MLVNKIARYAQYTILYTLQLNFSQTFLLKDQKREGVLKKKLTSKAAVSKPILSWKSILLCQHWNSETFIEHVTLINVEYHWAR